MTDPSDRDAERIALWGRRVPRVLVVLGHVAMLAALVLAGRALLISLRGDADGLDALASNSQVIAMLLLLAAGAGLPQLAAGLRRRHLPPEEAGFLGLGPIEIPSWKATRSEYWPLAVGVVATPFLLWAAGYLIWVAQQGPVPIAIPAAVVLALQGPVMIGFGLRQRRRFREWKRQQVARS